MSTTSELFFQHGDREFRDKEVKLIQHTFEMFPKLSQSEMIETVCEHLDWLTTSGMPKRTACKQLLEQMEGQGLITFPKKRGKGSVSQPPPEETAKTDAPDILEGPLKSIAPVVVTPVTNDEDRHLWNEYMERYHPLGFKRPFGHFIRYFVRASGQYLGCILISGASRTLASRDHWIGWDNKQRKVNLSWVINNSRYLIFPWINIPHLASHVLGQLARRVADDWNERWGFRPLLLETFVDPAHYSGICYKAAGWELLGNTSGRGLARPSKSYKSSTKLIYVKPLSKQCQSLLCSTLESRTEL
ncbi:MAG: DUF4338 domain-containing protein [Gammaproteobacteria bacterium]|nr:DUF4338 domain-containing protein [Gammaproteobacteria bacterium]